MQIQRIGSNYSNQNTSFKSAIPVAFWEKVGNNYELVSDINKVKRMQDILVRRSNGSGAASKQAMQERYRVMNLLYKKDRDYRLAFDRYGIPAKMTVAKDRRIAGSFYLRHELTGWLYGKFHPLVMLMTGTDKAIMDDMGRGIGMEIKKGASPAEIDEAKTVYVRRGKDLISMPTKDELHVIVEEKKGSYQIIKLDMYPSEGPKSPYTIMGYYK